MRASMGEGEEVLVHHCAAAVQPLKALVLGSFKRPVVELISGQRHSSQGGSGSYFFFKELHIAKVAILSS